MEQFYTEFKRDNNSRVKYIGPFSKEVADKYSEPVSYTHLTLPTMAVV